MTLEQEIAERLEKAIEEYECKDFQHWASDPHIVPLLRAALAQLQQVTQERDKWLKAFNESEQFQNGPTKRAEVLAAQLRAQREALMDIQAALDHDTACTAFKALDAIQEIVSKALTASAPAERICGCGDILTAERPTCLVCDIDPIGAKWSAPATAVQEPESVIHWLCPKGDDGEAPVMQLTQTLDDTAGRQRRYVCPKCAVEITVNYTPASAPAEEKP